MKRFFRLHEKCEHIVESMFILARQSENQKINLPGIELPSEKKMASVDVEILQIDPAITELSGYECIQVRQKSKCTCCAKEIYIDFRFIRDAGKYIPFYFKSNWIDIADIELFDITKVDFTLNLTFEQVIIQGYLKHISDNWLSVIKESVRWPV